MFSLAIHGGAGTITRAAMSPEKELAYKQALDQALQVGENILREGGTALDAVEKVAISLEDCELFNAGRGSVFTAEGKHEMDACIMRGDNLEAGAVAGISNVKNPIQLARAIMEKSEHVFLTGQGALEFAKINGIAMEPDAYFYSAFRYEQWQEAKADGKIQLDHTEKKFGTIGAVALDQYGNLAASTSTGGMTNKRWGRVGDSPMVGAGTYANNRSAAISCTGHGEFFIRGVVAYDVACLMEYQGLRLQEACEKVILDKMVKLGGEGGLVGVDSQGNTAMVFNSEGMYRGMVTHNTKRTVLIYSDSN